MRATTSSLVVFASCQALASSQLELISVAGWWSGGAARGSLEEARAGQPRDSTRTRFVWSCFPLFPLCDGGEVGSGR